MNRKQHGIDLSSLNTVPTLSIYTTPHLQYFMLHFADIHIPEAVSCLCALEMGKVLLNFLQVSREIAPIPTRELANPKASEWPPANPIPAISIA